jgi:hypothetical protein
MTVSPRTYLFALVDGGGTVPPALGAVRRLVERGHAVAVLGEDSIVEDVRATDATFRRSCLRFGRPAAGESIRRDALSGALVAELEGECVAEIVSEGALLPST